MSGTLPDGRAGLAANVLVADDDADICEIVTYKLGALGWSVDVTGDGASAVEAWLAGRHDLVVLDWMMPGKSGLEACAEIRSRGGATPRILMLTVKATDDDERAALAAGADAYLRKPFSPRELGELVTDLLAERGDPGGS